MFVYVAFSDERLDVKPVGVLCWDTLKNLATPESFARLEILCFRGITVKLFTNSLSTIFVPANTV